MFHIYKKKPISLYAPTDGMQIPLENVNDPVFATKMIGVGAAFALTGDTVYSPCEGTIHLIADTLHALGIILPSGVEILIHVGLETVRLQGQGFTPLRKTGDVIHIGTPILQIDRAFMEKQHIDLTIIVIVVKDCGFDVTICENAEVRKGISKILTLK